MGKSRLFKLGLRGVSISHLPLLPFTRLLTREMDDGIVKPLSRLLQQLIRLVDR